MYVWSFHLQVISNGELSGARLFYEMSQEEDVRRPSRESIGKLCESNSEIRELLTAVIIPEGSYGRQLRLQFLAENINPKKLSKLLACVADYAYADVVQRDIKATPSPIAKTPATPSADVNTSV